MPVANLQPFRWSHSLGAGWHGGGGLVQTESLADDDIEKRNSLEIMG